MTHLQLREHETAFVIDMLNIEVLGLSLTESAQTVVTRLGDTVGGTGESMRSIEDHRESDEMRLPRRLPT